MQMFFLYAIGRDGSKIMQTEILMPKYFGAVNLEALEDNAAEESAGRKTGSKSTAGDTTGK